MNKFEDFCSTFNRYCQTNELDVINTSNLHDESLNSAKNNYLYNGVDLTIYPMDDFVKLAYRIKYGDEDVDNRPNSVDCFVVNENNYWYFIEFKDGNISSSNTNLAKKAYCNVLMIIDVLCDMKQKSACEIDFNYENPIDFFRNNSEFIIVCSERNNPTIAEDLNSLKLAGKDQKVQRKITKRLKGYLFKDSYICTEKVFEKQFVKPFNY